MKRLLIILSILLLASPCFAQCPEENLPEPVQLARMNVTVLGGGVAAASSCPSGTYTAAWNGDHSSGVLYACLASGDQDGTNTGATVDATSIDVDVLDERVIWTAAAGDVVETAFTVWVDLVVGSDGTNNPSVFFELWEGAENNFYVRVDDDDTVDCYVVFGTTADNTSSSGTITRDGSTHNYIGVTIQPGRATADFSVTINGGSSWADALDSVGTASADLTSIVAGNYNTAGVDCDPLEIHGWRIISGWKAANPF